MSGYWTRAMKALLVERLPHRFAAARIASATIGSGRRDRRRPDPTARRRRARTARAPTGVRIRPRLAGICGSDLATLDGESSRYFEEIVSLPLRARPRDRRRRRRRQLDGRRVVVEPVLGCLARGIDPPCPACAAGRKGRCERLAFGHLHPGLQTGFCADTGGGWSEELVAHESQLHDVPERFSDEAAVMVEPTACAIHAALLAKVSAERASRRARRRHARPHDHRRASPLQPRRRP